MKASPLLFSLMLATSALAADGPATDYGTPADDSTPGRKLEIKPGTRNVSVYDGETVHFEVDGKRINWNFNTRTREAVLDLKTIAPVGMQVAGVRVYVQPNPLYVAG